MRKWREAHERTDGEWRIERDTAIRKRPYRLMRQSQFQATWVVVGYFTNVDAAKAHVRKFERRRP